MVDQHQRLLFVDAGMADRLALPAAGVDQPTGGEFDAAIEQGVVNNFRITRDDVGTLLGRNGRVFEEGAFAITAKSTPEGFLPSTT